MNWIRVAAGIRNDPSIALMADACRVRVAEVVGCVVGVLCELPSHAKSGDLSAIPDRLLEQWSGWEGKRGVFARAFREHLCLDGVVRSWEKHNGAAIREAERTRERVREWRETKKGARDATSNERRSVRGTQAVTNGVANAVRTRERNVTERNRTTSATAVAEVVGDDGHGGDVKSHFVEPHHVAAFERHLRAHPSPEAFLLELQALTAPRPSDGAGELTWSVIGQVLHELSLDGQRASSARIRTFASTVMRRERGEFDKPVTATSADGPSWDTLIAREEAPTHVP